MSSKLYNIFSRLDVADVKLLANYRSEYQRYAKSYLEQMGGGSVKSVVLEFNVKITHPNLTDAELEEWYTTQYTEGYETDIIGNASDERHHLGHFTMEKVGRKYKFTVEITYDADAPSDDELDNYKEFLANPDDGCNHPVNDGCIEGRL